MKKLLFLSIAFAVSSTALFAQSNSKKEKKEEIIIEDNGSKNGTTIEIKNGEIFIDGKKVGENQDAKEKNVKIYKQKRMFINGKEVPVYDNEEGKLFNFSPDGMDNADYKPMLGVTTKPSKNNDGAEVEMVSPNSPAQKLGLQPGDMITRINDKNILNPKDLVDAIGTFKPGDMIDVTFDRDNKLITKNVKLSERNDMTTMRRMMPFGDENMMGGFEELFKQFNMNNNGFSSPLPSKAPAPKIGISVEDRADGDGVLINDVTENAAAYKAGMKKEDVITMFGSSQISNVDELLDAISSNQNKSKVPVEIKRNGTTKKLEIEIPKVLKKKEL
jgi:predicted metalloprotease with PDZ domain